MKALVLESYNNLVYKDMPEPEYKPNEVLVRVKACGICGSDIHGFDGSSGRRNPPLIMGHEASGVIVEVGASVKNYKVGDRVTFDSTVYDLDDWYTLKGKYNLSDSRMVLGVSPKEYKRHGAFAEYVVVPEHILYHLPDSVTFEQAAMVESVAVAAHAIDLTPINLRDTALVVGTGMIGLFLVQLLKLSNAGTIIAIDIDDKKLALAKKFGADHTFNSATDTNIPESILALTHNRGADVAFEAVGVSATIKMAIENVRKAATVTLVGNISPKVEIPLQAVVTREVRLQGSCAIAGEYGIVLELIEKGLVDVDSLLSATAPLEDGADWFKRLYAKELGLNKVILQP
ncbi:galactitol-1-phosphate 5-dehydrogenase [Aquiflexum gelatinilyticum]|uniref:Galactitol-1-phosphate 5-dehydrogenase n=1 Tax=Aquiflexum gelatinilyticum TaxID=2961943 RepID=A0A9X2P8L5_9BACT|nr:galactitol-1-phosphate 5-dehydrogenase [Aquiflexum gelatinilyticum]MCR9016846.1 galactitol-1-phosphate 5-dehydrogenase [Aquiflexum gelatinilyticum]